MRERHDATPSGPANDAGIELPSALRIAQERGRALEQELRERTCELQAKGEELGQALMQLRDTQRLLATQEKLARLGVLAAGIAHDLKHPLNFVNSFADLSTELADELVATMTTQRRRIEPRALVDMDEALEILRENLVKIHEHGRRADQILDEMLTCSGSTPEARLPAELNAVPAESLDLTLEGA